MRSDHPVGRYLLALDPDDPDIPHADHSLTLEQWAGLLAEYDPEGMRGPPLPDEPTIAISPEARLTLYEMRTRLGQAIHHPSDVYELASVAICGVLGKKGGAVRTGAHAPPAAPKKTLWEEVREELAARAARTATPSPLSSYETVPFIPTIRKSPPACDSDSSSEGLFRIPGIVRTVSRDEEKERVAQ